MFKVLYFIILSAGLMSCYTSHKNAIQPLKNNHGNLHISSKSTHQRPSLTPIPKGLQTVKRLLTQDPALCLKNLNQTSIGVLNHWISFLDPNDVLVYAMNRRRAHWHAHQTSSITAAGYAYQSIIRTFPTLPQHPLVKEIVTPKSSSLKSAFFKTKRGKIAVLLPLTGPYAKVGQRMYKEIKKLIKFFDQLHVVFLDTRGDRDYAVEALKKAVKEEHAHMIVGPLGRWESLAIAPMIEWFEIPWFPLSTEPQLAQGNFAFHIRPTPYLEAQALVQNLCRSEVKSLAILHADHHYSRQTTQAIIQQSKRCGIKVLRQVRVTSKQKIQDAIIKLSGRQSPYKVDPWWSRLNRKRKHPAHHTAPHVNYQALLILLRGKVLTQAVSQLAWWDIEIKHHPQQDIGRLYRKYQGKPTARVYLFTGLGSIGAAHSVVAPQAFDYARMLALPSWSPLGESFIKNYRHQYGHDPSLLSQQIYDGFHWIQEALTPQVLSRKDLRIELLNFTQIEGIWGLRTVSTQGLSLPQWIIMTRAQEYGVLEYDQAPWEKLPVPED